MGEEVIRWSGSRWAVGKQVGSGEAWWQWKRTMEQKGTDQGKGNAGMRMKPVLTRPGM